MKRPKNKKGVAKNARKVSENCISVKPIPRTHGEWLETVIRITEQNIKNPVTDVPMIEQAGRLKAELEEWKNKNSK